MPLLSASAASDPATPSADETIVLSPFTVSADNAGRYQASEAASGSRVGVSLLDATQNVSVITRGLMEDVNAGRLLDATKYVAGVSESTIPNAQDRTNIRGFQADGITMDGFSYFSFANLDPVIVDRVEIVKGPNAILAPQGVPGGTANVITKRPFFSNQGYISGQIGEYNSNRLEYDYNRVLSDKLAIRIVGADQRTDDYPGNGNFHRSNIIMPELTYRFAPGTELTVELEAYEYRQLNYLGIPIDPYVGTNDPAVLIQGVSRELNPYDDDVYRAQKAFHARTFFTTNLTSNLSMRLATNFIVSNAISTQSNLAGANAGHLDPATGNWVTDKTLTVSRTYTRSYSYGPQDRHYYDLQADFNYKLTFNGTVSNTTAGVWLSQYKVNDKGYNATKAPFNIDNYTAAPGVLGTINNLTDTIARTSQGYVNENITFLNDRVILNGAVAYAEYQQHVHDWLRSLTAANDPHATMPSYGIVIKPIPQISLYYGHSKQSTAIGPSTTSVIPNKLQTSKQNEEGIRFNLLDSKLYATVSYFDIKQNNFSVPNPANLVVPPPVPALPALFMDRIAKGWEYELHASITKEWSLIGSYTDFTNRTPFGQVFRGIAEKAGAVWTSYEFKDGTFKGLMVGIGIDYASKRPGDAPSTTPTSASTSSNVILPQPTFWVPERTLVNASVGYRFSKNWSTQLNIDNLFNKEYIAASISRMAVYPGQPFNARLTVKYSF